jgi:chemotaxis protein methyltransferase CheR
MKDSDFTFMAELLQRRSGLVLSLEKKYLIESRLAPVARRHSFESLDDLVTAIRTRGDEALLRDVTEAMTTNESFFFRDNRPFDQFRDLALPALLERRATTRRIRIWSAACSSGQEPYSLAMLLRENAHRLKGWQVEILATDLSNAILDKARAGIYSQFEVQRGLPITRLVKYFKQMGDRWQVDQSLRDMVTFRPYNLLESLKPLGTFDIVFLRNVLIYFDQPTKTKVLNAMAQQVAPDGYLFLGGAETVLGITDRFRVLPGERGIYARSEGEPHTAAVAFG